MFSSDITLDPSYHVYLIRTGVPDVRIDSWCSVSGSTLTVTPQGNWAPSETCFYVYVSTGAVVDYSGFSSRQFWRMCTWDYKPPEVKSMKLEPLGDSPEYLLIEFTEMVYLGSNAFIQLLPMLNRLIRRSRRLASTVQILLTESNFLDSDKRVIRLHFITASGLQPNTRYRVYIPDDAVRDGRGNSCNSNASVFITTGSNVKKLIHIL